MAWSCRREAADGRNEGRLGSCVNVRFVVLLLIAKVRRAARFGKLELGCSDATGICKTQPAKQFEFPMLVRLLCAES